MEINREQIRQKILPKILQSSAFQNSPMSRELLTYLVQSTLDDDVPKETTIAINVFNKGADFNSNEDPSVRVNVSKLRQRLKDYYATEGRADKIRLDIPKGHYEITFQSVGRMNGFVQSAAAYKVSLFFIATTVLFAGLTFYFWRQSQHESKRLLPAKFMHTIFWNDFINSSSATNVVLSNQYVFREKLGDERYHLVRNYWVNNEDDLEIFRRQYPERIVQPEPTLMQFDKNSIWGLQHILPVLAYNPHLFQFSVASELSPNDLKENNILYVGSLVELHLLRPFLEKAGVVFQHKPNMLYLTSPDPDSTTRLNYYWTEDGFHNDYAIVAKLPGPNNKSIAIFAALNYMGNVAASTYFTNLDKLTKLENAFLDSHGVIPRYFVVVFEATGLQRVEFELKVKHRWVVETRDGMWK